MAVIHWFGGLNHKIRGLYRRSSTWKEWEPPAIETSTDMFMTGPRLYGRNIRPIAKDLPADVNISLNISANASEYRLCPASRFHSCWYSPWTDPKFQSFQHKIQFQMRSARNLQKSRNNRMFWNLQPVFSFIYIFIYFLSLFFFISEGGMGRGGEKEEEGGSTEMDHKSWWSLRFVGGCQPCSLLLSPMINRYFSSIFLSYHNKNSGGVAVGDP